MARRSDKRRWGTFSGRPEALAELLPRVASAGGWGHLVEVARVRTNWSELVGATVAAHSAPEWLARGRLTVVVDAPAWLTQLGFFKDDIRRKVNRLLSGHLVTEVVLRVGRVPDPPPPVWTPPTTPVGPEAERSIERQVATLEDPEVREAMRRVLLADFRRSRGRG